MRTERERAQIEAWQERLLVAEPRPGWRERAACRGAADLMFPDNAVELAVALAVCHHCPVRLDCLGSARLEELDSDATYPFGVRGGLAAGQRSPVYRSIRRGRIHR
jgi:hypothetical protein